MVRDVHRGLTAAAHLTRGTIILVDWYASTKNATSGSAVGIEPLLVGGSSMMVPRPPPAPHRKGVYWFSGAAGIQELDRHAANTVLARAGVQLKSRQMASERTVAVTLGPGRVVGHHLFWLTKTTPAGVVDADDAEDTVEAHKSA